MATNHSQQLENFIEELLKCGDAQALNAFLEKDMHEKTHIKCSQQFVTKLDKFISKSLEQKDAKSASLGFVSLYKCGKILKLPDGSQGLQGLITRGLIKKMSIHLIHSSGLYMRPSQWFEKCKQLWIQCGPHWDETLLTLSENFFSALMVVHEACKEGTYKITESFLYPVGQLAVDPRIYILIQKEAIRKYNLILDKIPVELKKNKKILTSQEASDIMTKMAGRILEGGDYDLQSSLMEALCRMATSEQRKKLADQWFSMGHVARAFTQISDSEFETACRRFLNMVNGMQGDKRRVYSYPCLEVYLDKYELLMPSDEKLEEFWIDFNLASQSISFYFSLPDEEEGHWETICISENEVQSYTVTDNRKKQVLRIKLSEVVVVGAVEGSRLTIHFSSSLDVLQAARSVYGHLKNKVVPESQLSLGESQKNTAPCRSWAPAASAQMVTPGKRRLSESLTFIRSSGGGILHSGSSHASKLSKPYFVPDTQHKAGHNTSSSWNKLSVSEMQMMPTQKMDSLSKPEPNFSFSAQQESCPPSAQKLSVSYSSLVLQKQLHSELTLRLQEVLKERNQNPFTEKPAPLQKEMSSTRKGLKGTSSRNSCGSSLSVLREKQAQRNDHTKRKGKDQIPLDTDPVPIKASVKTSKGKVLHDKKESRVRDETKRIFSSKENREAEIEGSMMKLNSTHHETNTKLSDTANNIQTWTCPVNKSVFNMSWLSSGKNKRRVKKHLFSDTDTDNAMTEVSWLRESTRKPKPKVTKYFRQALIKPPADPPNSSYESLELLPSSKAVGSKKPSKKNPNVKKAPAQPKQALDQLQMVKAAVATNKPHATGKRPSRAAATSMKSYREPDTDESQSELQEPPALKLRPRNVLQKTSKLKKKNIPAQMSSLKDSPAACQKSFPSCIEKMRSAEGSSPALNLTPSTVLTPRGSPLPASPTPPCHDTPSPILLLPKPRSAVSSKGKCKPSSLCSTGRKCSSFKIPSVQTAPSPFSLGGRIPAPSPPTGHNANKMRPVQPHLSSAPQSFLSPSSQPLLTSTLLELDKPTVTSPPQSPVPEDVVGLECNLEFGKVSSGSLVSLSQSSSKSSGLSYKDTTTAGLTVSPKTELSPLRLVVHYDVPNRIGPSRKRYVSLSSNSEEDEKEEKKSNVRRQHSPRMKPRKLFRSFAEVPAVDELSQVGSSFPVSCSELKSKVVDGNMDVDEDLELPGIAVNPRNLCQQFSSELKNKFQRHFKMMEIYSKQSSKTMQQHVSSISTQLTKNRTQRLERVKKVLMEEIQKMEQNDNVLKSMEKDLTMYWKKQRSTFHSYLKQETTRYETLKKTLQNNTCDSSEFEEDVFTSEMCLIRKDMKSAQDRLLNEMLDGEIQNVKRGLHTLFFP
ncbi:synaptonemal complex protein 2 [Xenentodon cancila]